MRKNTYCLFIIKNYINDSPEQHLESVGSNKDCLSLKYLNRKLMKNIVSSTSRHEQGSNSQL
jgi:hypothetical protein